MPIKTSPAQVHTVVSYNFGPLFTFTAINQLLSKVLPVQANRYKKKSPSAIKKMTKLWLLQQCKCIYFVENEVDNATCQDGNFGPKK